MAVAVVLVVVVFALRILYARRPPPLSEAARDPTEAESSKTNNKIKPLSIASQLRYVSMYEPTTTNMCVCVNALCAMVVVVANAKSKKEDEV